MTGCAWDDVRVADPPTADQLATLGEHVRSVRRSLRLSIDGAAAQAPMSSVTWTKVERGESVNPSTYAGVERSLLWSPGSIDLFFNTGDLPATAPGRDINVEIQDNLILEDLALIDQLPVSATQKLAQMRRYLRLVNEARNEAAHGNERRRPA